MNTQCPVTKNILELWNYVLTTKAHAVQDAIREPGGNGIQSRGTQYPADGKPSVLGPITRR